METLSGILHTSSTTQRWRLDPRVFRLFEVQAKGGRKRLRRLRTLPVGVVLLFLGLFMGLSLHFRAKTLVFVVWYVELLTQTHSEAKRWTFPRGRRVATTSCRRAHTVRRMLL